MESSTSSCVEVDAAVSTAGATKIDDLPEEILENIFSRLSPYNDLDNLKCVSPRWKELTRKVILNFKTSFEQSVVTGRVDCKVMSPVINESGQVVPPGSWISERFGHISCYFDKALYVVGGTTHTPTTFNDMWKFDLGTHSWSRCVASGQYPTPKALASSVQYKDNLVVFGGWSHPCPYPLMQPWRLFDELHIYNFTSNRWAQIITTVNPHPSAGHSASVLKDQMIVFGGRTFDQKEQAYPLSNSVWVYGFHAQEWYKMHIYDGPAPPPRYGQTQISISDNHILIIGGCGGPNQIFSDVWLLTVSEQSAWQQSTGRWEKVKLDQNSNFTPNDFHYAGCKIDNSAVFFERSSPISPFLAFLHFDSQSSLPPEQHAYLLTFEPSRSRYFHSNCTSGLRNNILAATMSIYTLNLSKIITEKIAAWNKEENPLKLKRPNERLLYSMVMGRAELILFGGFYKDPNSTRCRVTNDVFILKQLLKSY